MAIGPVALPRKTSTPSFIKGGVKVGSDFSGSPKKCQITFLTPYEDASYYILLASSEGRSFTYENKTANGFVINANASTAFTGEVSWQTNVSGES